MIALSRFLEKMLKALVIVANAAMLLLVFGQVITRYVFGWTPHFGEELARYLFVWVVFLCAVHLFSDQKEIDIQSGCN